MRLGVLGGSFNPPHVGHLIVASDAFEALKLDRLLIVPAAANPLKALGLQEASAEQRLEMVKLTFSGDSRFDVLSMELERGGLSYTVDTLEALAGMNKGTELVLILGTDSFATMDRWRRPDRIREIASIAILSRGDDGVGNKAWLGETAVTTRRVDVSSTEIRARVAAGESIRGFVTESVERYISAEELYRSSPRPDARSQGDRGKREC